jgi:predicted nucleic acid-binding protein
MVLSSTEKKHMSGRAFFDTNVLIYTAIKNDRRSERAEQLLAVEGVISVQVLNEFVAVARRKYQMSWKALEVALQWIRFLCSDVVPIKIETHEAAVRIAQRYEYRIYDSLIVASALEAKCDVLYSEDLQDGQRIEERLTIRNPFR